MQRKMNKKGMEGKGFGVYLSCGCLSPPIVLRGDRSVKVQTVLHWAAVVLSWVRNVLFKNFVVKLGRSSMKVRAS